MRVSIIKDFFDESKKYKDGDFIDETVVDIEKMLDWINMEYAREVSDDLEERDSRKDNEFPPVQRLGILTASQFSDFCNKALADSWGYVWGGRGRVYDEVERDYLYRTYGTNKYDHQYYFVTQWNRWRGRHVADCSGLIRAFSDISKTADGFYNTHSSEKGSIGSFPKVKGYLIFRYSPSTSRMVHVGVYDGDDRVIESKDSASGVVKTKFSTSNWSHWGKPRFIDFSVKPPVITPEEWTISRIIRKTSPMMRGNDVKDVQRALESFGYSVGSSGIDGIYGNGTYNAVRRFQRDNQLTVDGIVGRKTTQALGGKFLGGSGVVQGWTVSRIIRKTSPMMRGNDVRDVQRALGSFGYSIGRSGIDGIYGNDTYNAVRNFQRNSRLTVDGIVGTRTTQALGGR